MYARRYTTLLSATLREVTNDLYPCAVVLSQALCDVSRIGALGLSSVLARFTYGHIHTALFNCQGTVICGGSYQICRIHYGGSIRITNDSFIPSSSSHWEGTKGAMRLKFNPPHLSKGKNQGADHLKQWSFTVCLQNLSLYHSNDCGSFYLSPQLVASEKAQKVQ